MKPETELKNKYLVYLKEMCQKYIGSRYHIVPIESNFTQQGIPDVYCCLIGYSFWLEFKDGNAEWHPLQRSWYVAENYAGGKVYIIRYFDKNEIEALVVSIYSRVTNG